jgi:hypothetical protein
MGQSGRPRASIGRAGHMFNVPQGLVAVKQRLRLADSSDRGWIGHAARCSETARVAYRGQVLARRIVLVRRPDRRLPRSSEPGQLAGASVSAGIAAATSAAAVRSHAVPGGRAAVRCLVPAAGPSAPAGRSLRRRRLPIRERCACPRPPPVFLNLRRLKDELGGSPCDVARSSHVTARTTSASTLCASSVFSRK